MIRFSYITDVSSQQNRQLFAQAQTLFRQAFPYETDGADRIARWLRRRAELDFEPILLLAAEKANAVTGMSFVFYYPEIHIGYLQYIASDPAQRSRGIGGALYEATREVLEGKGARGLLLDVPPDDPAMLDDKKRLAVNRSRMKFYERFGARVVEGTDWDNKPNLRNANYLTMLMFDPLNKPPRLPRAQARKAVRRILETQYGFGDKDHFVAGIVRSFRDDPVRLRPLGEAESQQAGIGAVAPTSARRSKANARVKPIRMVVAEGHEIHHLRERGYVERPVRVRQILRGLEDLPIERLPAKRFPDRWMTAVHEPALFEYLKAVCARLSDKAIVYPEVFPIRRPDRAPKALEDRAGYFCADTFTPLTHNAFPAARQAADVALTAAQCLREGDRFAYALTRPPGHHAERRIYGGFCYLNNSGIAANYLADGGQKVALLDVDYHHGNGGQDLFYNRADVFTLSIHGHPSHAYPNFSGYADERGEGAGIGCNRNWPLEPPVDDARYLRVLEEALGAIRRFKPDYLVVSLGFDIMRGDPTGSFSISTGGLRSIAARLASLRVPTLFVQEGGYAVRNLRIGSHAFFDEISKAWFKG